MPCNCSGECKCTCTCIEECGCVCNCNNCKNGLLCDFVHYDFCDYLCDYCKIEDYIYKAYLQKTN